MSTSSKDPVAEFTRLRDARIKERGEEKAVASAQIAKRFPKLHADYIAATQSLVSTTSPVPTNDPVAEFTRLRDARMKEFREDKIVASARVAKRFPKLHADYVTATQS